MKECKILRIELSGFKTIEMEDKDRYSAVASHPTGETILTKYLNEGFTVKYMKALSTGSEYSTDFVMYLERDV